MNLIAFEKLGCVDCQDQHLRRRCEYTVYESDRKGMSIVVILLNHRQYQRYKLNAFGRKYLTELLWVCFIISSPWPCSSYRFETRFLFPSIHHASKSSFCEDKMTRISVSYQLRKKSTKSREMNDDDLSITQS